MTFIPRGGRFPLPPFPPLEPIRPPTPGNRIRFFPPQYHLELPDNLGRPPSSRDVTIHKGFDGLSPDEAVSKMRGQLGSRVLRENELMLDTTLRDAHKAFTVHLSNLLIPNSPHQQLVRAFGADAKISVLALLSQLHPHAIRVEKPGQPARYFVVGAVDFEERSSLGYRTLMEANVRLDPPGVSTVRYPQWSAPELGQKLTTITEL